MLFQKKSRIWDKIKNNRLILAIVLAGLGIRLLMSLLMNHEYDFFNILVLVKSVADTGSIAEGFFVVKRVMSLDIQLYGKLYYQIAALWLHILDLLRVVDIRYIFDNKAFDDPRTYLTGFGQWAPLLYQLVAIKMIQFVFDAVLFIYTLKISHHFFGKKSLPVMSLFWALNLYMAYVGFGMFQSDLAMVSFLVAGVYYGIKAFESQKRHTLNVLLMLLFFAAGAVIKQVPILFVVPFLIVISRNLKQFFIWGFSFALIYVALSQSYLADGVLTKQFFLSSEESMALFNFRLNDIPFFMAGYLLFTASVFFFRNHLRRISWNLILLSILIISIVYIFEDMRYYFVQFSVWIMPFMAFITLKDYRMGYFFIIPIIGFFRRTLTDRGVLSGSFGASLGPILSNAPSYNTFLKTSINPELVYFLLNTIQVIAGVFLVIVVVQSLQGKKHGVIDHIPYFRRFHLKQVAFALAAIFSIVYLVDLVFASQRVLLTKYKYDLADEVQITKENPVVFTILNPDQKSITGLQIYIKRSQLYENGVTYIHFSRPDSSKIFTQEIADMAFPQSNDPFYINLHKNLDEPEIIVSIEKDDTTNRITLNTAKIVSWGHENASNSTFDFYYKNKPVQIEFGEQTFAVNIQGVYGVSDIWRQITETFKTKPTFYTAYLALIVSLFVASFAIGRSSRFRIDV